MSEVLLGSNWLCNLHFGENNEHAIYNTNIVSFYIEMKALIQLCDHGRVSRDIVPEEVILC